MERVICNRRLDLTDEEYEYYLEIEKTFGKSALLGMFETDRRGQITIISPSPASPTPTMLIFFLLNIQLNQKLRSLENGIANISVLERRVARLEKRLKGK